MDSSYYLPRKRLGGFSSMNRSSWTLLLIGVLLIPICLYYFSAYWVSHQVLSALKTQDINELRQRIPSKLITDLVPNTHPEKNWQGAGSQYLKHVWPKLYQEIDREVWLSLHVQGLSDREISHYYERYFNRYALDLGSDHDKIRIEFERTRFIQWRVQQVCYPNPQPAVVENRCPSSNR